MMVVMVMYFASRHKGRNRILVAERVTLDLAAMADALIRLNMRAGRYFLQLHLNRLRAFCAFEREKTCCLDCHIDSFPDLYSIRRLIQN